MGLIILECFGPLNNYVCTWGPKMTSCLRKCLQGRKSLVLWGAILDILRKAKKAVRKMALNRAGSGRESQALEML